MCKGYCFLAAKWYLAEAINKSDQYACPRFVSDTNKEKVRTVGGSVF